MPLATEDTIAQAVGTHYGEYVTTFHSRNNQVVAHIFKQGNRLVAYVSFATGATVQEVTDPYLADLRRYAKDQGMESRLRIKYLAD